MKIVLCIVLIVLFGIVGFGISKVYLKRKRFFYDFSAFLISLKSEIGFSQTKLEPLINNLTKNTTSAEFHTLLNSYKLLFKNIDFSKMELFRNISILTEQEMDSIYKFFKELGRHDVYNQMEIIGKFENSFINFYKSASEDAKKYSSLYTKLGIVLGMMFVLIII